MILLISFSFMIFSSWKQGFIIGRAYKLRNIIFSYLARRSIPSEIQRDGFLKNINLIYCVFTMLLIV